MSHDNSEGAFSIIGGIIMAIVAQIGDMPTLMSEFFKVVVFAFIGGVMGYIGRLCVMSIINLCKKRYGSK